MSEIEKIAGAHLGKTTDGKTMQRYETPNEPQPSLLVGVPRELNRNSFKYYNSVGIDIWNGYEFSTLDKNGFPHTGCIRISYPSDSSNIVESKSLKLYLNSFNLYNSEAVPQNLPEDTVRSMTAFRTHGGNMSLVQNRQHLENFIRGDLKKVIGAPVTVDILFGNYKEYKFPEEIKFVPLEDYYYQGDDMVRGSPIFDIVKYNYDFTATKENPELLKPFTTSNSLTHTFSFAGLRSNCRVTNQPDWGEVLVAIRGRNHIDPNSLLEYLVSFRNENHFHEEVCEMIYSRLTEVVRPDSLMVACFYTRRGGIDINPIRCSSYNELDYWTKYIHPQDFRKTMRQ